MYRYDYVKIKCKFSGWGGINGNIYGIEDYRSIIDEKAKEGWRYVGFVPTKQRATGHIQELDLVFEKKID